MDTSFSDIVRFLEHVVWGVIGKVKSILAPESGSVR